MNDIMETTTHSGGNSKSYSAIKKMAFTQPELLHRLLEKFAHNLAIYCCYQVSIST